MIGSLRPGNRQVTIIGAGISGLLLAEALDRRDYEVTLLEAAQRAGGLIDTRQTPWGPSESAAHSLLESTPVRRLCERIGVDLVEVRKESRSRYVVRNGRLKRFPLRPLEALGALGRAYFMLPAREDRPKGGLQRPVKGQTLEQWARRFVGSSALEYLVDPFVTGIYGTPASEIDVSIAFPSLVIPRGHSLLSLQLHRWIERKFRQRLPSPPRKRMVAPRAGMGGLIKALEEHLEVRLGGRFRKGASVTSLPESKNLVLTVPAHAAAGLLESADPALSAALRQVQYTPLVSVTVFAPVSAFRKPPKGVGVLMPSREKRHCLGILFNSSAFPERVRDESQWVSLTVMMGGASHPDTLQYRDDELERAIRSELEPLFGLGAGAELHLVIHRWPRAIPRYNDELRLALERARQGWCATPGRALFGNYTGQVSLRGMIETAAEVARLA